MGNGLKGDTDSRREGSRGRGADHNSNINEILTINTWESSYCRGARGKMGQTDTVENNIHIYTDLQHTHHRALRKQVE